MGETGMWFLQDTQNSDADLRAPAYILDHALGFLVVSVADESASCPHEVSKGKNSRDKAGVSSRARELGHFG